MDDSKVTLLGTRGSVPVSGERYCRYGGATTCVLVRLAGNTVVLDAGTGMLKLPEYLRPEEKHLTLLLSHPHVDHLLGLPMCATVFDPAMQIDVYAVKRGGLDVREQFRRLLSPPLWPVTPEDLPAGIRFHDLPDTLQLQGLEVHTMEGIHPGGVSLLRLEGGGKRIVFATDCTLTEEFLPRAVEFAKGCDLLLCDGQYRQDEWARRKSFGHNTWQMAAEFGRLCGAGQTRIIHHDPARTDDILDEAVPQLGPYCAFAFDGEEITL